MKNKFILVVVLFSTNTFALDHKEYFDNYLTEAEEAMHHYYPGPLSKDIAGMALARQILEDGLNKGPNYSVAGTSVGGFNKTIVDSTIFSWLEVGRATDSEGGTFYSFRGARANICSALIIGRLFDLYVDKFMKKEKKNWFQAKEVSRAISYNIDSFELNHLYHSKLEPAKIVERANSLYGPQHAVIKNIVAENKKTVDYPHGLIIRNPTKQEKQNGVRHD